MRPIPPPFVAPQEINRISGPQFLAGLVNCGLLGVLSIQVFLYYLAFPNDRLYLKCLVYGLYTFEFVQCVLIVEAAFHTFVTSFGDVEVFNRVNTEWLSVPIFTALDTFFVQVYYAHRISLLARSKKVAGAIITLSLIQLSGAIAVGVNTKQRKYYSLLRIPERRVREGISMGIWTIGSSLCDIIIAICMTYYLSRYDPTVKKTKIILKRIVRLTIGTGSLTAIVGIVCFLLATLPSTPYYYQFPMRIIGKLYANSMLVQINSRMLLGSKETLSTTISVARFVPVVTPANGKNRDLSAYTETQAGTSGSSEP